MKGDFLQWPNFLYNPYFMENHSQYCEISRQSSENEVSHGLFLPRTQNMSFTQRHILYFLPYLSIFLIDYTCYHHVCLDFTHHHHLASVSSVYTFRHRSAFWRENALEIFNSLQFTLPKKLHYPITPQMFYS